MLKGTVNLKSTKKDSRL